MFGSGSSRKGPSPISVDTLIGRQTEVLGDVRFSGGLHVDGRIKGKVTAQGDKGSSLSISESGVIEGNVRVPHVVLNGTVLGDVHAADKITLAAKARVTGNVYYRVIQMESGALVNGQLVHESGQVAEPSSTAESRSGDDNSGLDELGAVRRAKSILGT